MTRSTSAIRTALYVGVLLWVPARSFTGSWSSRSRLRRGKGAVTFNNTPIPTRRLDRSSSSSSIPMMAAEPGNPTFVMSILGDLHLDPNDMATHEDAREQIVNQMEVISKSGFTLLVFDVVFFLFYARDDFHMT